MLYVEVDFLSRAEDGIGGWDGTGVQVLVLTIGVWCGKDESALRRI